MKRLNVQKLIISLLLVLCVIMVGCSKKKVPVSTPKPTKKTEKTTPKPSTPVPTKEAEPTQEPVDPTDSIDQEDETHKNTLIFKADPYPGGASLITSENYDDGTYLYEELANDGMAGIINEAFINDREEKDINIYFLRIVTLHGDGTERDLTASKEPELSVRFTYPAYRVSWTKGENEDTTSCTAIFALADEYTYRYGIATSVDHMEEISGNIEKIFSGLKLEEK